MLLTLKNMGVMQDYNLQRFVEAQEGSFETALGELRSGRKQTHWMWYIFPQIRGLGKSEISKRFAIQGIEEARAYLGHPILGGRLIFVCSTLLELENLTAMAIFGYPDNMK